MLRGQGSGFVWVTTGETTIFACYISPNVAFDTFSNIVSGIRTAARQHKNVVLVGDFNAKHRVWGSRRSDQRGNLILEWAASDMLTIHNDGIKPTFVRNNQTSFIDLALSSASVHLPPLPPVAVPLFRMLVLTSPLMRKVMFTTPHP